MSEMTASYLNSLATGYFIRQSVTIMRLFLAGYLIIYALNKSRLSVPEILLSFPVGISVYSLTVFMLLILHIKPTVISVFITIAVFAVLCRAITGSKASPSSGDSYSGSTKLYHVITGSKSSLGDTGRISQDAISGKTAGLILITVLCIAVISTSGLLPVSVSNDSLYYYSMYPSALVHFGEYRKQFNVFLTDVGQTSAMLNTIASMFGFNEAFGIQWFLNINTLLIFIYSLKEAAGKDAGKRECLTEIAVITGILMTSMPYLIMSRWSMSNGYFMCFIFICVYIARRYSEAPSPGNLAVQGILFTMMAFMRMEGCIVALVLVLCFSTLKTYTNRQLFTAFILPVFVCSLLYDIRIFGIMKIIAPYTFLTKTKAAIQLAALLGVGVYLLFIRGAVADRLFINIRILIPAGLVMINVLLFLYDRTLYVENMKAFAANISHQSGWGLFPMLIIGIYVMCAVVSWHGRTTEGTEKAADGTTGGTEKAADRTTGGTEKAADGNPEDTEKAADGTTEGTEQSADRKPRVDTENPNGTSGIETAFAGRGDHTVRNNRGKGLGYEDLCFIAYLLTALAVSFARDDALRESIGDSGNRVLLQGTLLAYYAAAMHVVRLLHE